jgi:hypothetical protein
MQCVFSQLIRHLNPEEKNKDKRNRKGGRRRGEIGRGGKHETFLIN